MTFQPVRRRSVPDEVFDQLVDDIVGGELAPGASLPSERRLAEELGASRPTVREALQRLAQAGLIDVRQGGVTTVRDFRRSAGLDLLPRLMDREGEPDLELVRSIVEVRAEIAPNVARRCAARRPASIVDDLESLLERMADQQEDPAALQLTAHELWHTLVDGTGNMVDRLLFNALEAAYLPALEMLTGVMADEVRDLHGYRRLVRAIREEDADVAAQAAAAIVDRGTTRGLELLERLRP
jgi:GntR family transcriptional regulator, transcriptional repressor for pyruvate dehydrogenase complex